MQRPSIFGAVSASLAIGVAFGLSQEARVETGLTLDCGEKIRGGELITPGPRAAAVRVRDIGGHTQRCKVKFNTRGGGGRQHILHTDSGELHTPLIGTQVAEVVVHGTGA